MVSQRCSGAADRLCSTPPIGWVARHPLYFSRFAPVLFGNFLNIAIPGSAATLAAMQLPATISAPDEYKCAGRVQM